MPLPVASGRITAVFGPTNERLDSGGVNKGLDVSVPVGTPVMAVVGGTVINAGDAGDGWGTSVKIRDAQGNIHNYGHLSVADVRVGATVRAGQTIAKSGNSGKSTGPHLSYDVKGASGQYIDPSPWLGFNAAGDNRAGHPSIDKDIASLGGGQALNGRMPTGQQGAGTMTQQSGSGGFWQREVDRINAALAEVDAAIAQGGGGTFMGDVQAYRQSLVNQLENAMINLQLENEVLGESGGITPYQQGQLDQGQEGLAQGQEGLAQGWAQLDINKLQADIAAGRLTLDQAIHQLNQRMQGAQESRQRAQFVSDEMDRAARWAPTEPGKSAYTGNDLGAVGGMLAQRGIDPNATVAQYGPTRTVDPMGLLAQYDEQFGVGGSPGAGPGSSPDNPHIHDEFADSLVPPTTNAGMPIAPPTQAAAPAPVAPPAAPSAPAAPMAPSAPTGYSETAISGANALKRAGDMGLGAALASRSLSHTLQPPPGAGASLAETLLPISSSGLQSLLDQYPSRGTSRPFLFR